MKIVCLAPCSIRAGGGSTRPAGRNGDVPRPDGSRPSREAGKLHKLGVAIGGFRPCRKCPAGCRPVARAVIGCDLWLLGMKTAADIVAIAVYPASAVAWQRAKH